jgi:citrate lyase beta subunit
MGVLDIANDSDDVIVRVNDGLDESLGIDDCDAIVEYEVDEVTD